MASHCQIMLELMYTTNGIPQSTYVWWHIDSNNMYSMIHVKFVPGTFISLINEKVQLQQH
jgi:hypothetical protein